jgi:hypothetical protein
MNYRLRYNLNRLHGSFAGAETIFINHHKKEGHMNHWYKYLIQAVLVAAIIIILMPINLIAIICANGSGGSFCDEESISQGKPGGSNLIESHVIEGAGHFLNAYSNILLFLNRVEKSDLEEMDYNEAALILDRAIDNMENALTVYNRLIAIAERTPYNKNAIDKLMDFDYKGFMIKNGLNIEIFKNLERYLKNGDVTGMYIYINGNFQKIKKMLKTIKNDIDAVIMTENSKLWLLNEKCSEIIIFGQYASRIFIDTNI